MPLEVSPGREATCREVFGTWGFFPDDARASHCPFVLTSFTGWSSERCPGIGFLSRGDREIGVLPNVKHPRGHVWNVVVSPASSRGATGRSGTPSRQSRGVDPPVETRRVEGAQRKWCRENLGVPLQGHRDAGELCGGASRVPSSVSNSNSSRGTSPETL